MGKRSSHPILESVSEVGKSPKVAVLVVFGVGLGKGRFWGSWVETRGIDKSRVFGRLVGFDGFGKVRWL